MTIKAIEIENFQSHELTLIEPHDKVTLIKGPSDSGKSGIIRALIWALKNRPRGADFRSTKSSKEDLVRVAIEFDKDEWVSREKTDKDNMYRISSSDDPLKAIRADVPEEVQVITKMTDLNIQSQYDPFYMLQESPGQVGRMFSEAVGLKIIEESTTSAKRKAERLQSEYGLYKSEVKGLKEQLTKYDFLDDLDPDMHQLHILITKHKTLSSQKSSLEDKVFELEDLEEIIKGFEVVASVEQDFDELDRMAKEWERVSEGRNKLKRLIYTLEKDKALLREEEKIVRLESDLGDLLELAYVHEKIASAIGKLSGFIDDLTSTYQAIQAENDSLASIKTQFNDLLLRHRLCPLCQSPIVDETIENIQRSFLG